MPKIYTRTGDHGMTSLASGHRVKKDHPRVEAYGTLDELNAFTGLLQSEMEDGIEKKRLTAIQQRIFIITSNLALDDDSSSRGHRLPSIIQKDIDDLEMAMDAIQNQIPSLKHFILPGGSRTASLAHVARTVCRRSERQMIRLAEQVQIEPLMLQYINRLSDYFFMLARLLIHQKGLNEQYWDAHFRSQEAQDDK
ncbi:MAG: cob(I)yrinic acid a,c-diamide adenosyltransferase [Bacteroidales bacterium]|nr:cob(I)yrinic acid a,c-diamide adenosyltransferase [Bacteroidales bacterium]